MKNSFNNYMPVFDITVGSKIEKNNRTNLFFELCIKRKRIKQHR